MVTVPHRDLPIPPGVSPAADPPGPGAPRPRLAPLVVDQQQPVPGDNLRYTDAPHPGVGSRADTPAGKRQQVVGACPAQLQLHQHPPTVRKIDGPSGGGRASGPRRAACSVLSSRSVRQLPPVSASNRAARSTRARHWRGWREPHRHRRRHGPSRPLPCPRGRPHAQAVRQGPLARQSSPGQVVEPTGDPGAMDGAELDPRGVAEAIKRPQEGQPRGRQVAAGALPVRGQRAPAADVTTHGPHLGSARARSVGARYQSTRSSGARRRAPTPTESHPARVRRRRTSRP